MAQSWSAWLQTERTTGVEPARTDWKSVMLPATSRPLLCFACVGKAQSYLVAEEGVLQRVRNRGLEPLAQAWHT